jgi:D-alanyl-D-alanine carboxypeptidase
MSRGETRTVALCLWCSGRVLLGTLFALWMFGPSPAAARHWHGRMAEAVSAYAPTFEWIVLDAETGQVLGEQNADALTYPASLTKMMTLYLTFEALNQGRITLDQRFTVSEHAATKAPSKLGLTPGEPVSVRDLILGVVTKSANDAATVLAEGLAGDEGRFAQYMTWKARQLGMQHTWYQNASGLPDPNQRTTARDVARLALALYHQFPREYRYFATREFDFRGEIVHGHDHLLDWYPGADGIKTGFINASGFNLATSAVRNGHRLIGVIMGGRTWRSRDVQMASLLDQGFAILAARPQSSPAATAVAAVAPRPIPVAAAPSPAPAPVAVATAPPPPAAPRARAVPAPVTAEAAAAPQPSDSLGGVAQAALRHLAPVARAEAAPLPRKAAGEDEWSIQIGAFREAAAAEQAVRHIAHFAVLRGKPHEVLAPARSERPRLYRTRLLHFTAKSAQTACTELHRHGIACSVVRPGGTVVNG